jgi:hypothetical protein
VNLRSTATSRVILTAVSLARASNTVGVYSVTVIAVNNALKEIQKKKLRCLSDKECKRMYRVMLGSARTETKFTKVCVPTIGTRAGIATNSSNNPGGGVGAS